MEPDRLSAGILVEFIRWVVWFFFFLSGGSFTFHVGWSCYEVLFSEFAHDTGEYIIHARGHSLNT